MCAYDGFGFGERTVFDRDAVFDVGLACGGMEMASALLPEIVTTQRSEINEANSFAIASSYSVFSYGVQAATHPDSASCRIVPLRVNIYKAF